VAYDEGLAERVREVLEENPNIKEKKMFGGLAFMLSGNMACGLIKEDLIVRVGAENYEKTLGKPHAHKMEFTGRAMKGFVMVDAEGCEDDKALAKWVKQGVDYARSLPAK
jgi:TfoX/Sxy family transcriptional regulator of competence genes